MNKILYSLLFLLFFGGLATQLSAGNPDRQGEAGAYELLMVPYARMAGLHAMTTASVSGVEAIRLNPAGLSRFDGKTEFAFSSASYLQGTGINMNAAGFARKVGKSGAFGVSLMSLDFGDIPVTTEDTPEGIGTTYRLNFFNLGATYAHTFENKVTVGLTFRVVSEATADIKATAFAIDAGVQYVTGDNDNFKFGISLRNIGNKMKFAGEGLNVTNSLEAGYTVTVTQRAAGFDLPTMLNIGTSYDFYIGEKARLTTLINFTSNSFSQDQLGGGLEFALGKLFMLRGGYKYEFRGGTSVEQEPLYTGLSAGATLAIPLSKKGDNGARLKKTRLSVDYAYRQTKIFNGTHNIGFRFSM